MTDTTPEVKTTKRPPAVNATHLARVRSVLMTTAVFLSIFLLAVVSLVSVDLALLGFVILSMSGFYWVEKRRESNIRQSLETEILKQTESRSLLEEELKIQAQEIQHLKNELATAISSLSRQLHDLKQPPIVHKAQKINKILNSGSNQEDDFFFEGSHNITKNKGRPTEKRKHLPLPAKQEFTKEKQPAKKKSRKPIANDAISFNTEHMSDLIVRELIHTSVKNKKIDVFFQPVFRLPAKMPVCYEVFARIRAKQGVYIPASRYLNLARADSMMGEIDNMLLMQCLQTMKDKKKSTTLSFGFFINLNPEMLREKIFMGNLLGFLGKNTQIAKNIIFEISQDDFRAMKKSEKEILLGLTRIGCVLSLDHVTEIPENIGELQQFKIRFIKLKASLLLDAAKTGRAFSEHLKKKRKLETNGIGVIIEHIESAAELTQLSEYNIRYAQGYVFGYPSLDLDSAA